MSRPAPENPRPEPPGLPETIASALQGTLHWSLILALGLIIYTFYRVVTAAQVLLQLNTLPDDDDAPTPITAVAAAVLSGLPWLWCLKRFLQWIAALWRVRPGAGPADVESLLQRQSRMWAAVCITVIVAALAQAAAIPLTLEIARHNADSFDEYDAWKKSLDEESKRPPEPTAESAHAERMKKLEEEYYREKAAREAAEKKPPATPPGRP